MFQAYPVPYSVRLSWESAHRTGFGLLRHARLPEHYTSRLLSCRASSTVLAPLQRNNGGTSGSPRYFRQVPPSHRKFGACAVMAHGHLTPPKPGEESVQSSLPLGIGSCTSILRLHVTFVDKEGDEHTYKVSQGDNLLDIAQSEDLEMEGRMRPYPPSSQFASNQSRCLWRILRVFYMPCHCRRYRHVRQNPRTRRRRERYAGSCVRSHGNIAFRMSSQNDKRSRRAEGQIA